MKTIGIIIARGGSKGLPRKNVKILGGKPLIVWTIEEAKKSKKLDRLILSTEDEEIASIGKNHKVEVPFKRPIELASDTAHTPDILINALDELEKIDGSKYDIVVLLQPTVPFRKVVHIDMAIKKFKKGSNDSLITITKQDYPPWWMFELDGSKIKTTFEYKGFKNVFNYERQQFPNIYRPNGSVYITKTKSLRENRQLVNPASCGYLEIMEENQINIDSGLDFLVAETILEKIEKV